MEKFSKAVLQFCLTFSKRQSLFSSCKSAKIPHSSKMSTKFCLNDYDAIGFDLDFTLVQYNVPELVRLEYFSVAKYLVEQKGYNEKVLFKPMEGNMDFLQKGLFVDFSKGNIVKMDRNGKILQACHGMKMLTNDDIMSQYGVDKKWDIGVEYGQDMIKAWNGPLGNSIRPLLDYFDTPSLLAYCRIVADMDRSACEVVGDYPIWPDILDGLQYMFQRSHFETGTGGFFSEINKEPSRYYYKTDPATVSWLKELNKSKFTYLITGSNVDFANMTATYGLGENWKDYFDVIVTFARKPMFFFGNRPFYKLEGNKETGKLVPGELSRKSVVSQGNWAELKHLISETTKVANPKCLYIGDNLIQDVYSPKHYKCCDTVAIASEMKSENVLVSNLWSSYFHGLEESPTFWSSLIRENAELCIANIEELSRKPVDFQFSSLFYPSVPLSKM